MFVKTICLRAVWKRIGRRVIVRERRAYPMTYNTIAMSNSGLDESSGTEEGNIVASQCLVQWVAKEVVNRTRVYENVAEF